MKLTKLHIFLIILIAFILCSCLGICSSSTKEGYMNSSSYHNYGKYYSNLNDANISATDWSQGLDSKYNNPYYNKNDEFHRKYDRKDDRRTDRRNDRNNDRNNDRRNDRRDRDGYSYKDDLNGGNKTDSSTYMISTSVNKNKRYNDYNNDNNNDNNPRRRNNDIFSSVSSGAVNGSIFSNNNNSNSNSSNSVNNNNNGVRRDQIPQGQEDLYILKSQALTPICPACPPPPKVNCDDKCGKAKCPPCPPCARCPEPQFDCVKVPNYNTKGLNQNLPIPWMAKL